MKRTVWLVVALGLIVTSSASAWAQEVEPQCRLSGDPLLIGASSFFIPGLGQFFNGEDGKGLVHLVVGVGLPSATYIAALLLRDVSPRLAGVVILASPLVYLGWAVHSAMDVYHVSKKYCQQPAP